MPSCREAANSMERTFQSERTDGQNKRNVNSQLDGLSKHTHLCVCVCVTGPLVTSYALAAETYCGQVLASKRPTAVIGRKTSKQPAGCF